MQMKKKEKENSANSSKKELPRESVRANESFFESLKENATASQVLRKMALSIQNFRRRAPRRFKSKCIDGRVHGSDAEGYPPTTVTFSRTEGNKIDLTTTNPTFWRRLNGTVNDAKINTPGVPVLFSAMGHYALDHKNGGCAAHHENDEAAEKAVLTQAEEIRKHYTSDELYAVHGMTNTDDGSERVVFENGAVLDTSAMIEQFKTQEMPLQKVSQLFTDNFRENTIDDVDTHTLIRGKNPGKLMEGLDAAMFEDLQCKVAMESYLFQEVSRLTTNAKRNNIVFDQRIFDAVKTALDAIPNLPTSLKSALIYQTLWNIAYTLHRRERNELLKERMAEKALTLEMQHAENRVAYGEGFELNPRNTVVLVKPGRGDELEALRTAKIVIEKNRHKRNTQEHPPLVHINVEVPGKMDSWQSLNSLVLANLSGMIDNTHSVFGQDCRILTTYSYTGEKRFYPIRITGDPTIKPTDARESYPCDIAAGLNETNFSANMLQLREEAYTLAMMAR
jgi:hypothetical protein